MLKSFHRPRLIIGGVGLVVLGLLLLLVVLRAPPESKYLKDPTLVATKAQDRSDWFVPKNAPSFLKPIYKRYYQLVPPRMGASSFAASGPTRCSIHGLLGQCHDVSGVQFFIDKQVASGSVVFGSTNALNGPLWVSAFTNAVQTGSIEWWDAKKRGFRKDNPVFIAIGKKAFLILPKDRAPLYREGKD